MQKKIYYLPTLPLRKAKPGLAPEGFSRRSLVRPEGSGMPLFPPGLSRFSCSLFIASELCTRAFSLIIARVPIVVKAGGFEKCPKFEIFETWGDDNTWSWIYQESLVPCGGWFGSFEHLPRITGGSSIGKRRGRQNMAFNFLNGIAVEMRSPRQVLECKT